MKKLTSICILIFSINNVHAQDSLKYSRKQVADDMAYLMNNAADIHPNLYHDVSKQQLISKVDSLTKALPDSLSLLQTYRAFAEATAFIDEGHTGVNIPRTIRTQRKEGAFKMIPLKVTDYDGKYLWADLIAPDSKLSAIRVLAINGETSANIFKQMAALKGGLPSFRKVVVTTNFRLYLKVIGITAPYTIEYLDPNSTKKKVTVNSTTESEYQAWLGKPADTKNYTFKVDESKVAGRSMGYMNFRSMVNYDGFKRFCDSVFKDLSDEHINKLIVDLRENSGGNSQLGWYLLNYITNVPFRMAGESERKVSQQFKDHIKANKDIYGNDYDEFLKMQNGSFWKIGDLSLDTPADKEYKFKGKVCFLIGPYTFSSANMLSAAIKDFKLATLIGEPTGEPGNDYGELCDIKLPQTGFIAFTSTTMWVRPSNNKLDAKPIYPDYMVKRTSAMEDNVLQYAQKWLSKQN